jgi:endo-beta-N-acetylglucosaminidase D
LYGLGTNTGLKRVSSGTGAESYSDWIENEVIEYIQFHKDPGMKMGSDWWYGMVTFRNGKSPADYFFIDE